MGVFLQSPEGRHLVHYHNDREHGTEAVAQSYILICRWG